MKIKISLFLSLFVFSCGDEYTPKPRAFYKIDLPQKNYKSIRVDCPFVFEIPDYSELSKEDHSCFYNLNFSNQKAILHLTYLSLNDNLQAHTEESRSLAYKHDVMADAIAERIYVNDSLNVYGILYDYDGMTATAAQFYLTDSASHFFRGALYFNTEISDSLLPVNNFLKEDIKHIIESCWWINY